MTWQCMCGLHLRAWAPVPWARPPLPQMVVVACRPTPRRHRRRQTK